MAIKVTRQAVMANALVDPAWYPILVQKMEVGQAKKDGSTNWIYTFKFIQEDIKDCFIKQFYINEKGLFGSGLNFIVACAGPEYGALVDKFRKKEIDEMPDFDENLPVDKVIMAKINNTTFEGRTSNEAVDFMPMAS